MSRQGLARSRTLENVKEFWNKEAQEWGDDPRVTIRDHYFRLLELDEIRDLVKGKTNVLDIGCGSGFSTLFYSQVVGNIIGADYAPSMVDRARRFLSDSTYFMQIMERFAPDEAISSLPNVRFEEGNILAVMYSDASFDAVVAERVLINLPTQQLQDDAVGEMARVVAPGGRWILVEVTRQGHQEVDRCRQMFGLPILEKYWHNLYLDEQHFESMAIAKGFRINEIRRFETYQFLTKVVHPLIVSPAEPSFLAGFNRAARLVSRDFPTYQTVLTIGLDRFLRQVVRDKLVLYDADKLPAYDLTVRRILSASPDFTGCSHQVLFSLERM